MYVKKETTFTKFSFLIFPLTKVKEENEEKGKLMQKVNFLFSYFAFIIICCCWFRDATL